MLVDFGIAKFFDEFSRTSTVARAVTPGYSPLEQYGLGKTDERSDVYALGATVYKLLTAETPNPSVDIAAGTAAPPAPAHEINPNASKGVSLAIQRAMQLRVKNRTPSVVQFKSELQKSLNINPWTGRSRSKSPRWLPWVIGMIFLAILLAAWYAYNYLLFM